MLRNNLLTGVLVLLLLILQYQFWFGFASKFEVAEKTEQYKNIQAENDLLQEKYQLLNVEYEDLKNGVNSLEDYARSSFGMIKEEEIFVQTTPNQ